MTTRTDLPAAMVEAAKAEFLAVTGMPGSEPHDTEYAARILAAALSVCDVREERRGVVPADTVPPSLNATGWCRWCVPTGGPGAKVERRWVITTPAEPVEDNEGER